MSQAKITTVIPQLPSANLKRTRDFLVDKLGFECTAEYGEMSIFQRDEVEIHYWQAASAEHARRIGRDSSCYFKVENIRDIYEEFTKREVNFGYPLEEKPWGMLEMQVNDPDRNALRFGEALKK